MSQMALVIVRGYEIQVGDTLMLREGETIQLGEASSLCGPKIITISATVNDRRYFDTSEGPISVRANGEYLVEREMIRGSAATERRDEPKRSHKPYRCAECGKRYTLRGAERAMANGCAAGCSGIDIEEAA